MEATLRWWKQWSLADSDLWQLHHAPFLLRPLTFFFNIQYMWHRPICKLTWLAGKSPFLIGDTSTQIKRRNLQHGESMTTKPRRSDPEIDMFTNWDFFCRNFVGNQQKTPFSRSTCFVENITSCLFFLKINHSTIFFPFKPAVKKSLWNAVLSCFCVPPFPTCDRHQYYCCIQWMLG